ncbi:MAG: rhomboid family intramembrane serine protease [Chitinophagales bacterium]
MTIPWVNEHFGLFLFESREFHPYQIVTHMFSHANIGHIFLNMFALWMFGTMLENVWGPKRFLIFYLICGLGASILNSAVNYYEYTQAIQHISAQDLQTIKMQGYDLLQQQKNYLDQYAARVNVALNVPTVGASGAIFGILVAFGMLFPNTLIYVYFLFPIKAKFFVIIYIAIEVYYGFINSPGDNVAHFAHLGGALFGFLLVKFWNRSKNTFY